MTIGTLHVEEGGVDDQQKYGDGVFPLVLTCQTPATLDGATAWIAENRRQLHDRTVLHGAILFRGFPLRDAEDFDAFVAAFDLPNFPYDESLSNAVRVDQDAAGVHGQRSAADGRRSSSTTRWRRRRSTRPGCSSSASSRRTKGGATPLCRSDVLWERLAERCPRFAGDCEAKGLKYSNVMPAENDPDLGHGPRAGRARCGPQRRERGRGAAGGSSATRGSGCRTAACGRRRRCCRPCGRWPTAARSFFNQLIAAFQGWKDARNDPSKAITFGDGTPLDRDAVQRRDRARRGAGVRRALAAGRRGARR